MFPLIYFTGIKRRLYPPLGTPEAQEFFQSGAKPEVRSHLYDAITINRTQSITKKEFIATDLAQVREADPSLENFKKQLNIRTALTVTLQSSLLLAAAFHPAGAGLIPLMNLVVGPIADHLAGKISHTRLGDGINKAVEGIRGFLANLPGLGHKEAVTFGASQKVNQTSGIKSLVQNVLQALERFQAGQKNDQTVKTLTEELTLSLTNFIRQEGDQISRQKLDQLEALQADVQAISQAILAQAKKFSHLTTETQEQIFTVIYQALVSDLPPAVDWGRMMAGSLGISSNRIDQIIETNK